MDAQAFEKLRQEADQAMREWMESYYAILGWYGAWSLWDVHAEAARLRLLEEMREEHLRHLAEIREERKRKRVS